MCRACREAPLLTIAKRAVPPDVVVLEITGRITIGRDCQEVEWEVDRLLAERTSKVVFDLSHVSHMDSTGIGIVVLCSGKLKAAGGGLRISGATGLVDKVLRMTSVDNIVPLDGTPEESVRGLSAAAS